MYCIEYALANFIFIYMQQLLNKSPIGIVCFFTIIQLMEILLNLMVHAVIMNLLIMDCIRKSYQFDGRIEGNMQKSP